MYLFFTAVLEGNKSKHQHEESVLQTDSEMSLSEGRFSKHGLIFLLLDALFVF